ncbi:MAG: cytochrome c-type biogenesis CcmF C-terminal domain-containing protein [Anaerolineae bacterium]|nr:cytochrome c-type biogenesis CcmF C-terminal domain-containing protein [Anaerolineae bacterium]
MLGEIGTLLLGFSLVTAIYTSFAAWIGIRTRGGRWAQSAQRGVIAVTVLTGIALIVLWVLFLDDHFEIQYVAQHSSTIIPVYLKISALWAGQEGSLLLWCFLQALFAFFALHKPSKGSLHLIPWATVFLNLISAFFISITLTLSNPFSYLAQPIAQGQGLNPLLRHPGMIFHPPALYIGYVGLAVPYAFAMAALVTRQIQGWTAALRSWILIAWLGLGLGLLLGMRWAYDVLGWGGYWGWDPVENAGLLPWFTSTALLHSSVMQQEKRGFKFWNMLMGIFSFVLVLFGTFATRSGMIQSVHAYAQSNIGNYFLAAILVTLSGSLILLFIRYRDLTSGQTFDRLFSRDGMFFLTLVLLSLLTISVFIGSILPTISEALTGQRFEAGPAWFDRVTGPQFGALVVVIGLCPLLGRAASTLSRLQNRWWLLVSGGIVTPFVFWLTGLKNSISLVGFSIIGLAMVVTTAEFIEGAIKRSRRTSEAPINAIWQLLRSQRRKYGGYLVHIGVIFMAIGILGTRMYPFEQESTFSYGQPTTVGEYTFIYESLQQELIDDYTSTWATLSVYRGAQYLTTLEPRLNQYASTDQSITVPALYPTLREDIYIILSGWSNSGDLATFKVVVNPLINFLWLGGLIFMAGGALALWPRFRKRAYNALAFILGLLLLLGAGWAMWGIPHGEVPRKGGRPLVGQPAPEFRLTTLEGDVLALSELRGQIVVVNFWASWCPPCIEEMPELQLAWESYQDKDVLFLGIAYQEQEGTVLESMQQFGTSYPVGLDVGDRISELYGITGVPETYIVDPEGKVAYMYLGPVTADILSRDLAVLLAANQ